MSSVKLGVLGYLYRDGSMTPGALAAAEGVQPQSLTRVLADLEECAYIRREQDETDRRQFRLELTAEGREVLERDAVRRAVWLESAMSLRLTETEQEMLRLAAQLMDKLATYSGDQSSDDRRELQKEELI